MTLAALLADGSSSRERLSEHLDLLRPEERVAECVGLSGDHQKRLWQLTSSAPHPGGDLISSSADPATEFAVFAGRNSLSMFTHFEKRFASLEGRIFGYNNHALGWLIGPGYFTVEPGVGAGRLRFDYSRVPSRPPDGWPAVLANSRFPARFVYGDLLDEVAWVTADVLIGSALRAGAPRDSYFVLARAMLEG